MDIPTTAAGLLVILLGVLPGLPGDYIYRTWIGVSWRERDAHHLLRLLSFSVLGLVVYSVPAVWADWYLPEYVIPTTFTSDSFSASDIPRLGIAYLGHFSGSAIVGTAAAAGIRFLRWVVPYAVQRDTWDHFIRNTIPRHWVLVTLNSGDTYTGILDHADITVEPQYRDLILSEPYILEPESGEYQPTYQQFLFLKGSEIASVAVVCAAALDKRVVPVTETPFRKE
jgi:hypothetical protein